MNDFDPGEGWRDVTSADLPAGVPQIVEYDENGIVVRCWIAEEPVPLLPTEENTLIRVMWRGNIETPCRAVRDADGDWTLVEQHASVSSADLQADITGFEVLAAPRKAPDREAEYAAVRDVVRRETAKAVLDRVERDGWEASPEVWREFGVEVSS